MQLGVRPVDHLTIKPDYAIKLIEGDRCHITCSPGSPLLTARAGIIYA
jgi:hypothetical protein